MTPEPAVAIAIVTPHQQIVLTTEPASPVSMMVAGTSGSIATALTQKVRWPVLGTAMARARTQLAHARSPERMPTMSGMASSRWIAVKSMPIIV